MKHQSNLSLDYLLEHYQFNFDKTSQYVKQMMSVVDICLRRLTEEQFAKTRGMKPIIKNVPTHPHKSSITTPTKIS